MRCEILNAECDIANNDCSTCPVAEKSVKEATEEYLRRNQAVISNYSLVRDSKSKVVTTVWFQIPIAEVAKGKLKVENKGL